MKKSIFFVVMLVAIMGVKAFDVVDNPYGANPPEDAVKEEWTLIYDDYRIYVEGINEKMYLKILNCRLLWLCRQKITAYISKD